MTIPAPFTPQQIADQLTRDGHHWHGNNGDNTIYYSFSSSLGYWWGNTGEYALDSVQQQWVNTALDSLSDLFNLNFIEVSQPANTQANPPVDYIQFVNDTNTGTYSSSYLYTSGPNAGGITMNAVVFDQSWNSNQSANLDYGSYGYMTILHEILHSLGLEHPGDYNAGSGQTITYLTHAEFEQDTHRYSVMSYFASYSDGSGAVFYDTVAGEFVFPRTAMVYDILAMTSGSFDGLFGGYGANSTTRNTDTTYGHNATPGIDAAYDFDAHGAPVLTIYDTGGIDTLDLSGDTVATEAYVTYDANNNPTISTRARTETLIDLRPGAYSSTHGMEYNIGIAYGTEIENAIGTIFDDTIYGNKLDNNLDGGSDGDDTINGNAGNDVISGRNGNDTLDGGSGNDTIDGGSGDDTIYGRSGVDVISGGTGDDYIRGQNSNDVLSGDSGNDTIYGNKGRDTLIGGDDDDTLYGGSQDDVVSGQDGNDTLFGGGHNDDLYGGRGDDELNGDGGKDFLSGGQGDDILFGGNSDDILEGNKGSDELRGGLGDDLLTGGSDAADTFVFDMSDGGVDTITDFQDTLDVIRFTGGITSGDITVADHGSSGQHALITVAGTSISIVVENIDHNLIDNSDFVFV